VTDHRRCRLRRLDRELLQPSDALRHRLENLGVQNAAVRDQLLKICGVEPRETRWLSGAEAGKRRRSEKKRDFAEVLAGIICVDPTVLTRDHLEDRELPLEQREERGGLAFENEPLVGANANVRGARGQRRALVVW